MPHIQELCGLRIGWLAPGQVCFESMLGLNEYAPRNVVARFPCPSRPLSRRLNRDQSLTAMLCDSHPFQSGWLPHNPLVEMLCPATLFQFEAGDTHGARLAHTMMEVGAADLFSGHLEELERVGMRLARKGQARDLGIWGTSVYFHTLWVYGAGGTMADWQDDLQFAGHVDLYRLPLAMFAEPRVPVGQPQAEPSGLN